MVGMVEPSALAQELGRARRAVRARLSARSAAIWSIGPAVVVAGLVWVVVQPYRLTLLHPHGQSLWWLLVEPQLLVILAGAAFSLFVGLSVYVGYRGQSARDGLDTVLRQYTADRSPLDLARKLGVRARERWTGEVPTSR